MSSPEERSPRQKRNTRPSTHRGRQMPLSRKDSASAPNNEKSSFEYDNIAGGESYRPASGLRRTGSVRIDEQDEAEQLPNEAVNGEEPDNSNYEVEDDPQQHNMDDGNDDEPYDLRPPPPTVSHRNMEMLASRFFSVDHLDLLLQDPVVFARFHRFLKEHRPEDLEPLQRYIETRKAVMAVEYANSIAHSTASEDDSNPHIAATLDEEFEAQSRQACDHLIEESMPAYITHRFVGLVTDTLVKEITGNSAPIMKELVPSLAEVYCLSDPSLPDNPIVYASEEFFSYTQYGRDYTFGRNCRFLQGPKTSDSSIRRLIDALNNGREIVETILNYRRDGTPFMNLLMISPLYDNKNRIRYFLGCQIDVSPLVEGGRGLESFAEVLKRDRSEAQSNEQGQKGPKDLIAQLGAMLNDEEVNVFKNKSDQASDTSLSRNSSDTNNRKPPMARRTTSRLKFGMSAIDDPPDIWPDSDLGVSGRLPGVYQNYMLVRPYPSLRITFTSPALRIPGLVQTKLLDRIGGPQHVREGIFNALEEGAAFTAKITWHTNYLSNSNNGSKSSSNSNSNNSRAKQASSSSTSVRANFRRTLSQETPPHPGPGRGPVALGHGKARWIHCTPLLGSDDRVGVWMVVMVEAEEVTGRLNRSGQQQSQQQQQQRNKWERGGEAGGRPQRQTITARTTGGKGDGGRDEWGRDKQHQQRLQEEKLEEESESLSGDKMYAEYLRNEGNESRMTSDSARERQEVDDHFRDF